MRSYRAWLRLRRGLKTRFLSLLLMMQERIQGCRQSHCFQIPGEDAVEAGVTLVILGYFEINGNDFSSRARCRRHLSSL